MVVVLGTVLCLVAVLLLLFITFSDSTPRLPVHRRRPPRVDEAPPSVLSRVTGITTSAITDTLNRHGWTRSIADALDRAGIRMSPADFLVLVGMAGLVAGLLGFLTGGPVLALLALVLAPVGAKIFLSVAVGRRQKAFADQLDDTLQLFAGSLRAGHSLLRAVDAVSREAQAPTTAELARVVNQTRLGRDLNSALNETAERMASEDFSWVSQAIGIHREVGGDLAEVLDQVGHTIRERNQIRRQVRALSAEGKMSAYILIALPIIIPGIMTVMNPAFIRPLFESVIGYGILFLAFTMLTVGALWMRKIVSFKF
ncbi:type II secretion system protein F [Kocuria rosea subsp. polaris]|uniref:Type II secretion system protein F n=1 Tax=Kocuria rosea subsp. polaris TaxID=136273 RepID=A0A0W8IQ09_KOCRO|nr:type II secretion system F family protein [Kocuria polaris]KUG61993.1 type II secretion system protein F [Kocuria polaris]